MPARRLEEALFLEQALEAGGGCSGSGEATFSACPSYHIPGRLYYGGWHGGC
jgi:hypothetical protein